MHKSWYYWGFGVTAAANLSFYLDAPFIIQLAPSCIYVGWVSLWHGWMFLRHLDSKGWGKHLVGLAFIGLGIHSMDMPFLISVSWFAPWGFFLSGLFRLIISMGTLMVYLEKNFRDLVSKEEQYRLLAENATDVIYLYRLKPTCGFEYISPSAARLTGHSTEQYYTHPDLLFSLVHPQDSALVKNLFTDPVSFAGQPLTLRLVQNDGSLLWIEQTTVPIFDEEGSCIRFEGIIRDISARKKLEQDVSRLDQLNTVGQMASNVAHEIRNPLTTVHGYLQLFLHKPDFHKYHGHFSMLIKELERANEIIKTYLSLCQNKARERKPCQLNHVIRNIYPLIKADAIVTSKEVRYSLESIPDICLDEKELRQLILNLVHNSIEATDPGGSITIRTYANHSGEVVLCIQDQGKGIAPHILENIGKPFLTTKEQGIGLGLAVVYRIANDNQAKIQVESSSKGTTFQILFKAS